MRFCAFIVGCGVLAFVLIDCFNTILLARRTRHRFGIAHTFYRTIWPAFAGIGSRIRSGHWREEFLSVYGPLSLLAVFALWAIGLVVAFGLLQWAAGMQPASFQGGIWNDLYLSASTLFTLSTGDPKNSVSKLLSVTEGGLGLAFLGLAISYLPVLYQSFAQRELFISLLDARAGSPPSAAGLLRSAPGNPEKLERELGAWEKWTAQLLENHLSFPMPAYFRSQHANQSWLTALVAIVDLAAVVCVCSKDDLQRQAGLTFAMGRHVLADVALVFGLAKEETTADRLPDSEFSELCRAARSRPGLFDAPGLSYPKLKDLRRLYESQASALSRYLLMSLPAWTSEESNLENWKSSVTSRDEVPYTVSDPFAAHPDSAKKRSP